MTELDRVLRTDGVYVMNVIDGADSRFSRAQLRTMGTRFDHLAAILPPAGVPAWGVNQVLVGSVDPLPPLRPPVDDGRLLVGADLDRFVGAASVLTDDHAPVDHLKVP
jgi:hypothetical protein